MGLYFPRNLLLEQEDVSDEEHGFVEDCCDVGGCCWRLKKTVVAVEAALLDLHLLVEFQEEEAEHEELHEPIPVDRSLVELAEE